MQKKLKFILGVLSCVTVVQSPAQETSLWYDAPAVNGEVPACR